MLAMLFTLSADRYALPASDLVEILPLATLKRVPAAPLWLAGLFNYHGAIVPVLDLSRLIGGTSCRDRLSSRILLTRQTLPDGRVELLGLMVEQATETARIAPESLRAATGAAPWLGPLALQGTELVQCIHTAGLLSDEMRALLYSSPVEASRHAHSAGG